MDEHPGSAEDRTSYHALWAGDEVIALVRLLDTGAGERGESYRPGQGWVESTGAYDVLRNGQDYDLLTAAEAEELARRMEAGEV